MRRQHAGRVVAAAFGAKIGQISEKLKSQSSQMESARRTRKVYLRMKSLSRTERRQDEIHLL
jgi:hypothetical protein